MRAMPIAIVTLMVSTMVTIAQTPPLPSLPAIAPPEGPLFLPGTDVSRPLTPVEPGPVPLPTSPSQPVPPIPIEQPNPVERVEELEQPQKPPRGPLGPAWNDFSLLLWWPKAAPLPPLVTATRSGQPPILDVPGTTLLVGGRALSNQEIAGGRFTIGRAMNTEQTIGFEVTYFFLGSRSNSVIIADQPNSRVRAIGLPYVDAATGENAVFSLVAPGTSTGSVYLTTTTRMQGVEANGVANLINGQHLKLNGLVGYRYLQVNEGLTIEQMRYSGNTFGPIYDQFDGHNQFNGGQLGLQADLSHGIVYCEVSGKVALGRVSQVVKIEGATNHYTQLPGGALSLAQYQGGVYALSTNIGRYSQSNFAVVPEGTFKVGIKLSESGRFYVGYNFLYLSSAVRPGDQVDRTLNSALIPTLNPAGSLTGPDRPLAPLTRSDFWAQGLIIGLETRY